MLLILYAALTIDTIHLQIQSRPKSPLSLRLSCQLTLIFQDFGGRASSLIAYAGGSDKDDSGHGTHIAGIIGSATYGVAKNTRLYSVKVLDRNNEGTVSNVIAGLDFITADAPTRNCPNGSFVNMSFLARGVSSIVDAACERVVAAGVFLAVAAGNEYKDVYYYSPARLASVCTVAATGSDDAIASWSNYGAYVNVLAPGADITSLAVGGGSVSSYLAPTL